MTTKTKLYPFQETAVKRMEGLDHVLLLDDMGLGKTLQSLEHVQRTNLKPCLIICPKTLIWNWYDEIVKWYPDEVPIMFHHTDQFIDAYIANKQRFFILWHDVLARFERDEVLECITRLAWGSVIVDEAHLFRNWNTKRGDSLLKFKKGKKIILTGTPIVNSALDLYPLVKLTGLHVNPTEFARTYTYMRPSAYGAKSTGFRNRRQLMDLLGDIWIRRTKAQVLKDLPDKISQRLVVKMQPDQEKAYNNLVTMLMLELDSGETLNAPGVLALLMRLRQVALDPNMVGKSASSAVTKTILDIFGNAAPTDKIVVYSNFKQYINVLQPLLERNGINTVRLTGDENPSQRASAVRSFQSNPNIRGFLATMQSGGVGINLTKATTVIITDLWWNKTRMDQAIDRTHRIGQVNKVHAITLHVKESIYDHIEEVVNSKNAVASEIIDALRKRGF